MNQYRAITQETLQIDLSQRWIIERGLIAAAALILDVADHILVGYFGVHAGSYEESLIALHDKEVITQTLYQQIKGLGGFRNVLVHLYQEIDLRQVVDSYQKGLTVFPRFAQEVLSWLDDLEAT